MVKISLAIIAKNELDELNRIIKDYNSYFDEIVIGLDDKVSYDTMVSSGIEKVKVYFYDQPKKIQVGDEFFPDFAAKRNWLASLCTGDYYFRLDCDDQIIHPEKIKEVVENAVKTDTAMIYCWYNYSRDADGNVNAGHYRETILKKDDNLIWNKPIHENVIPKNKLGFRYEMNDSITIEHNMTEEHALKSMKRNLAFLIDEYNKDKDKTDPRTLAYLGRTFMVCGDYKKAVYFLEKHIQASGWDEDRHLSWCMLSDIHRLTGEYDQAIAAANEAIQEKPDLPEGYYKMHDIYFEKGKYSEAIVWAENGMNKKSQVSFMIQDPSANTWRMWVSLALCYLNIGDFDNAMKFFEMTAKLVPNLKWIKDNRKLFEDAYYHREYLRKFSWLLNFVKENDTSKIPILFDSIPKVLSEHPTLAALRINNISPKWWNAKSIVIYCGEGPTEWADPSVNFGIGGSEEAVIYISRELVKLGYEVTVYNNCGELEGIYNGVKYINYYKFNPRDFYNIIIAWRRVLPLALSAKKYLIWLHDVPSEPFNNLLEQSIEKVTKIIVLSNYHKSLLSKVIPEDKILVSNNGINAEDFTVTETRVPKRLIYASSYDRGLDILLENWSKIKSQVPEAELYIYYGWNTYDSFVKAGMIDDKFKRYMLPRLQQPGIHEMGRVGHKELNKAYQTADIFAYSCDFPEINCIALTKAIANGCLAVTTDFAAVGERNPNIQFPKYRYIDELIKVLKSENVRFTEEQRLDWIKQNSWETVAKQWVYEVFKRKNI